MQTSPANQWQFWRGEARLWLYLCLGILASWQAVAQTDPAKEEKSAPVVLKPNRPVWTAKIVGGYDSLDVLVYVSGQGDEVLSVSRVVPNGQPPTPASMVEPTLYLRDGREIKPKPFTGMKTMVSATIGHGGSTEDMLFDLTGVPLEDLQAIQIRFNGQPSRKTELSKLSE